MINQTGKQRRGHFRTAIYLWLAVFLATQISFAQNKNAHKGQELVKKPAFHPNRLLIKPKAAVAGAKGKIAALHSAHGGKVLKSFKKIGDLQVIEFPPGVPIEQMADLYSHDP